MSDNELLARIEQQAVEIGNLKSEIETYQRMVASLQKNLEDAPQVIYQQMAKAAVNCGASYGCGLASRYIRTK